MEAVFVFLTLFFLSADSAAPNGYQVVWQENFEGNRLNRTNWFVEVNCDGGGNNELQCYTDRQENILVGSGHLTLKPRLENYQVGN